MPGAFIPVRTLLLLALIGVQSLGVHIAPTSALPQATAAPLALATTTRNSLNWSGYVAYGGVFSEVSGSWTLPAVVPGPTVAADATWVGIGGVGSRNLIQAGTQAIVDTEGDIAYEAWVEKLPDDSITVPLAVHPGDAVTVDVHESAPHAWHIDLYNNTTGQDYATTTMYDSTRASAEWIEEMPTGDSYTVPLDNFGSVQFISAFAVENGKVSTPQSAGADALSMVDRLGDCMAAPSVFDQSGSGFRITRVAR